jgi:hypothetical protein
MLKNASENMQKYAEIFTKMQAYALTPPVWILREYLQKYALNLQKYALYVHMKFKCKICRNLHPPLC